MNSSRTSRSVAHRLPPSLFAQDPLSNVSPERLAQVWENKTWFTTYTDTGWELDAYVEAVEHEIAALEIWVQHWDSELGSEEMFR
jgi:hypothetical protein